MGDGGLWGFREVRGVGSAVYGDGGWVAIWTDPLPLPWLVIIAAMVDGGTTGWSEAYFPNDELLLHAAHGNLIDHFGDHRPQTNSLSTKSIYDCLQVSNKQSDMPESDK